MSHTCLINKEELDDIRHHFNIMLFTITAIEYHVAYQYLSPIDLIEGKIGYYEYKDDTEQTYILAKLGLYYVALTKILEPGMTGQHSIGNIIHTSFSHWSMRHVFMLGICATTDKDKFPFGSVIVSKEVIAYERVKQTVTSKKVFFKKIAVEERIDRSPRYYPGFSLKNLDLFISQEKLNYKVEKGVILSGEKLINSKVKLNELKKMYPNAIAIEMEGVGFASSLQANGIDEWVIIKGVSDDAIHKQGDDNQENSMKNVMDFCVRFFSKDGMFSPGIKVMTKTEQIQNNVLISGSYNPDCSLHQEVEKFSFQLARKLVKNGYKIITGYGLSVGPAVVAGTYQMACDMHKDLGDVLEAFPFPRTKTESLKKYIDSIKEENRLGMINEASIVVFLYGQKTEVVNDEKIHIRADGVWDEFVKSSKKGLICVPIGSTGFIAQEIWEHIMNDFDIHYPKSSKDMRDLFSQLNDENLDLDEKIDIVIKFIKLAVQYKKKRIKE